MIKSQKKIIFISGEVGSGKTTLRKYLLQYLDKQKTCYRNLLAFPLFSYIIYKLLSMLLYGHDLVKMYEKVKIHPATLLIMRVGKIPRVLSIVLECVEVISVLLKYVVGTYLVCRKTRVIVIDEGPINMIANYFEVFGIRHARWLVFFILRLLSYLGRRADMRITFLYVSSKNELLRRWITRRHPLPTAIVNLPYLMRYNYFIRLSKTIYRQAGYHILEVDTCKLKPDDTFTLIVRELELQEHVQDDRE